MNRSMVVLLAVTLLSGCDAISTTALETLDCTVQRSDGGPASDVSVQCTGTEDAGAVTTDAGTFTLDVTVRLGGVAGWTDQCGQLAFSEGGGALDARWKGRDGGITAQHLDGVGASAERCSIVVE